MIYLDGETVYTEDNNHISMMSKVDYADNAVSCINFPSSERIILSRVYDGYYDFRNVKTITFNDMSYSPLFFDDEVFLACYAIFTEAIIYPIDPNKPMSVNVVIFNPVKRRNFQNGNDLNKRRIDYANGAVWSAKSKLPENEIMKLY